MNIKKTIAKWLNITEQHLKENDDIWTIIIVVIMIGYLFTMALLIG